MSFAVTLGLVTVVLTAAGSYHIVKRIPIPGDSGWDYITADTNGRRLYVPYGIEVVVLDLDTGATVGKITGLRDAHGVASRAMPDAVSSVPRTRVRSPSSI